MLKSKNATLLVMVITATVFLKYERSEFKEVKVKSLQANKLKK